MNHALLDYPCGEPPGQGALKQITAGVWWLRMPLPFRLDHVNLWVLEDGDGVTLVDTGIDLPAVRAAWEQILATPLLRQRPPTRLICTHFHPDHMGLAGWLADRQGIPLWATLGEWAFGRMLAMEEDAAFVARALPFYRQAGSTPWHWQASSDVATPIDGG